MKLKFQVSEKPQTFLKKKEEKKNACGLISKPVPACAFQSRDAAKRKSLSLSLTLTGSFKLIRSLITFHFKNATKHDGKCFENCVHDGGNNLIIIQLNVNCGFYK